MQNGRKLAFASLLALAATAAGGQEAEAPAQKGLTSAEVPLASFMPREEAVMLNGAADEYRFSIPYSSRLTIRQAVLDLQWTNSISLIEDRSQLRISLNGEVLGQASLRGQEPEGRIQLNLPATLFRQGYNDLALKASQHYTTECEDPTAPELWTEINPARSLLKLDYELAAIRPSLAEVEHLVSPLATGATFPLDIVTGAGDDIGGRLTEVGARIAAGMALRLRYVPLTVTAKTLEPLPAEPVAGTSEARLAGAGTHDVALVGTRAAIAAALPADVAAEITGPYLALLPIAGRPGRFALVVSGTSAEDVLRAAEAFSLAGLRLPDRRGTLVGELAYPELPVYGHVNALEAEQQYRFEAFGMETTTLGSGRTDRLSFETWVPPDLFVPVDASLEMHLHLAYGAGASPASSLALFINDDFVSAIRLGSREGGVFRDYTLLLPATWLQPGPNRIEFRSFMQPEGEGSTCFAPSDQGLMVTLFDDSWLALSAARHHVSLPSLGLMARTGFPYSAPADGRGLHVALADDSAQTQAAAWTLFAKLVQQAGTPLHRASFGAPKDAGDRHMLLAGTTGRIPPALLDQAPVRPGPDVKLTADGLSVPEGRRVSPTLRTWLPPGETVADEPDRRSLPAVVGLDGSTDGTAWLLQFESPSATARLVTLATAATGATLLAGVHDLVRHERWGAVQGSVAAWDPGRELMSTSSAGPRFTLGDVDLQTRASLYFTERPAAWTILIAGAVLAFVFVSVLLLRKRARRQS
jgi:hypothetical protein